MEYRVGIGYDIHRLVKGRKLFLGGVEISYSLGAAAHSDGDMLLHAICDALLGAISADDIGRLFPNTDRKYKNIRSTELLKKVYGLIKLKGYSVNNLDTVVIAQAPKIGPFKNRMRNIISKILKIKKDLVNIKATTSEGIGDIGKDKAIAAYATVMLKRRGR